jgi:hypothetical protein
VRRADTGIPSLSGTVPVDVVTGDRGGEHLSARTSMQCSGASRAADAALRRRPGISAADLRNAFARPPSPPGSTAAASGSLAGCPSRPPAFQARRTREPHEQGDQPWLP